MDIKITKGLTTDTIDVVRSDETSLTTSFPKKGPFPHDVVHWVVERNLNYLNGFWGKVAAGFHPEELGELVRQHGHASAARAEAPDEAIIELVQAERLVECFEVELWSQPATTKVFNAVFCAACDQSHVARRELNNSQINGVRQQLAQLKQRWDILKHGESLRLNWT